MKYHLKYKSKKTGMIVMGKRVSQFSRQIELSTGEIMSASWASANLTYLGRYEETGSFVPYEKPKTKTITTPNGFKIVQQEAL